MENKVVKFNRTRLRHEVTMLLRTAQVMSQSMADSGLCTQHLIAQAISGWFHAGCGIMQSHRVDQTYTHTSLEQPQLDALVEEVSYAFYRIVQRVQANSNPALTLSIELDAYDEEVDALMEIIDMIYAK